MLTHTPSNPSKLTNTAGTTDELTSFWILHHVLLQIGVFIVVKVNRQ
jgi:hypothetical protein